MMDWKNSLLELKEQYSDNQIAVLLNLSHGAVAGKMVKFKESDYKKSILEISKKIKHGEDLRKIFFVKWCERVTVNKYGMLYRFLREQLGVTDRDIFDTVFESKNPNSFANLCSYANSINVMPQKSYENITLRLKQKGYSFDENRMSRDYELFKERLLEFKERGLHLRCPSLIKLCPASNNLKGTGAEVLVYRRVRELYPDSFMGATITNDFKKRDAIDILVIDKGEVTIIEVKGFKNIKWNTLSRRLKWALSKLQRLRIQYPEIGKAVCVLPFIEVSDEWKHKFNSKDVILIDKSEFEVCDKNAFKEQKRAILPSYYSLREWLNKWKLSLSSLQILLKDTEYCRNVRNMTRPDYKIGKAYPTLRYVDSLFKKDGYRKLHFKINRKAYFYSKDIEFWRNVRKASRISLSQVSEDLFGSPIKNKNLLATLETGKKNLKWLKNLYIEYLSEKTDYKRIKDEITSKMKYNRERWRLARNFPMAVGLADSKEDRFEEKIAFLLMSKGYKVVTNALINDKTLSKMTLNFHHPEVDIVGVKNGEFVVVGCKDFSKCKSSQFIVSAEAEIDVLAEWLKDMEFSKAVFAAVGNIPEKSWKTLERYAESQNVEVWRFPLWTD